jgi:hypothetical protein
MEKRIGVIVGRFQVPYLGWYPGYKTLLKHVANESDQVLILLGESNSPNQSNPLSFEHRQAMFAEEYPDFSVAQIPDMSDDIAWVHHLDAVIHNKLVRFALQTAVSARACLYGGIESFLTTYHQYGGRFPTTLLPSKLTVNNASVNFQSQLKQRSSVDMRAGLIQAWGNRKEAA